MTALDAEFLKVLACPECHGALAERGDALICLKCAKTYPIKAGIPDFLTET